MELKLHGFMSPCECRDLNPSPLGKQPMIAIDPSLQPEIYFVNLLSFNFQHILQIGLLSHWLWPKMQSLRRLGETGMQNLCKSQPLQMQLFSSKRISLENYCFFLTCTILYINRGSYSLIYICPLKKACIHSHTHSNSMLYLWNMKKTQF